MGAIKSLQHVQVPNNMCVTHDLEPFDVLVYANIKKYMNKDTLEAWPSITVIAKNIGCKREKVIESIRKLNGRWFTVYKKGKKNVYSFNRKYTEFEPFSYGFLEKKDITNLAKAYILVIQQFMFKDLKHFGKVSFTNSELSELINMSAWEIRKCDRELLEKGYLNKIKTKLKDFDTGLPRYEKVFNLARLKQAIIWLLYENKRLAAENNEMIDGIYKDAQLSLKQNSKLRIQVEQLKKQLLEKDCEFSV